MTTGATAAVIAAQQRLLQLQEEEERLTHYTPEELGQGWEFKIVRANTAAFRNPGVMQKVCSEEAQAGWVLVEKFDDQRLRFKRPMSARKSLVASEIDPYRTTYGISAGSFTAIILVCVFGGVGLIILIAALLTR